MLQSTTVDLNDAIAGILKMLRRVLRENIRVAFELPAAPLWVDLDVGMLQQALMNLALNAQDAMPGGGDLAIEVRPADLRAPADAARAERRPGRFARLSVADSGHGMDDATLRRAFDPFFTTKPSGRGCGLGLATV